MKPAPFAWYRPRAVGEALDLLARYGEDAKLLAGGQSLVPLMNLRMVKPAVLIDLNVVSELAGVRRSERGLSIGAMTRQAVLLADKTVARDAPLIAKALRNVGHVQTRSRGTIGGSLAHADPAAELPLVMVALDAVITAKSVRGTRDIRAREFFHDVLTTALAADELILAIHVAAAPAGTRSSFREYARGHGDFAIAAAAVQRAPDGGGIAAAVGGVAAAPHLCASMSGIDAGPVDRAHLDALARREVEAIEPLTDHQAAGEYRRRLGALALAEALEEVLQ
jgi:CO/xanthine dehydrogenase FAD-binding subunit